MVPVPITPTYQGEKKVSWLIFIIFATLGSKFKNKQTNKKLDFQKENASFRKHRRPAEIHTTPPTLAFQVLWKVTSTQETEPSS